MEIVLTGILLAVGWYIAPFVLMVVVGIFASIVYFLLKIIQVKHSSGYINELCYISLAFGLMDAAEKVEGKCPDDGVITRKADYQTNKRLKRRISKLKDSLLGF